MTTYRRKPTTIEAVQWDGEPQSAWNICSMGATFRADWGEESGEPCTAILLAGKAGAQGLVDVPVGHWVAMAADDDFYPIDPDVFSATYELC